MGNLTDEQRSMHLANNGANCPECGCDQVEGHTVTTGDGGAMQEMTCIECPAEWTDIYKLVNVA